MSEALTPVLPEEAFAQAKARFSDVMDQAVHGHRVQVIDRHRGKERAVLVSESDLGVLLESFEFQPKVSVSDGEFVIRLPELNVIAGGETYEAALAELVEIVEIQARDFFERLDFVLQTDRRGQLPWLLKFAVTPAEERIALFSREAFWEAMRSGEQVERPVPDDQEEVVEHEAWVMAVLVGSLHLSAEEIASLSSADAVALVHDYWSGQK